jgi:hypothetical protein
MKDIRRKGAKDAKETTMNIHRPAFLCVLCAFAAGVN